MLCADRSQSQGGFSHRWYARSRCRGQGQEVSGPRSGKSPRVAMLRRSPLALKQPSLGEKGWQRRHDRAALGEGLALRWSNSCKGVAYLLSLV